MLAVVATSSLRRQAQVRRLRPDLQVQSLRGNVETRLKKLADGVAQATILAMAGLNRLGLQDRVSSPLAVDVMLPAVAQGAVGIQTRADDFAMTRLIAPINHQPTGLTVAAERAFLAKLDGSCRTPIAGLAELSDDLELALIDAERDLVNNLYRAGELKDEGRRRIERELDLRDTLLANLRSSE